MEFEDNLLFDGSIGKGSSDYQYEIEKKKDKSIFEFFDIAIKKDHKPMFFDGYSIFMMNRMMSRFQDTIEIANIANQCSTLNKQANFDFYYHLLPKLPKRYMPKKVKVDNDFDDNILSMIVEVYQCSIDRAKEYYRLLEKTEQLEIFAEKHNKGGEIGNKKSKRSSKK